MDLEPNGECSRCSEPICWLLLKPSGKRIPLDLRATEAGTIVKHPDRDWGANTSQLPLPAVGHARAHGMTYLHHSYVCAARGLRKVKEDLPRPQRRRSGRQFK